MNLALTYTLLVIPLLFISLKFFGVKYHWWHPLLLALMGGLMVAFLPKDLSVLIMVVMVLVAKELTNHDNYQDFLYSIGFSNLLALIAAFQMG